MMTMREGLGDMRPIVPQRSVLVGRGPAQVQLLEGFLGEVHDRQVRCLDDRALGGQLRQHRTSEPPGGGDLALVEVPLRLVELTVQLCERDLRTTEQ